MRTLLLGTDFCYNSNGDLVPVEINTNVGWERISNYTENVFDMTPLTNFVTSNNFTKITYIGGVVRFNEKLVELAQSLNIEYDFIETMGGITIPFVEDSDDHLIIRSAYDVSAIVDESYCKDKIGFLTLIQNSDFASKFAYKNENNEVVSTITSIPDNGIHPNFILKARYPVYDREVYPSFFRVQTQEELNYVIENYVTNEYFLMEYHFNSTKLENNVVTVIRSLNILISPSLESIHIGTYKKFGNIKVLNELGEATYDSVTHKLSQADRLRYLTGTQNIIRPKLLDTDLVVMGDGSFKTGAELQVGDVVKTIRLYENQPNISDSNELREYTVDFNGFISGSTFSTNVVTNKKRADVVSYMTTITFDDGTEWKDTHSSVYLIKRGDSVLWATIGLEPNSQTSTHLQSGDKLLLIQVGNFDTIDVQEKTVVSISDGYEAFNGWIIGVQDEHIFLTATNEGVATMSSFVAVEHNYYCQPCYSYGMGAGGCDKMYEMCTYGPVQCGDFTLHCAPV